MARKKGDKGSLSPTDKEVIYQTFLVTQNKAEAARRCKVSGATVTKVIQQLESAAERDSQLPTAREARAQVAARLSGRMHSKAEKWMDSITDADMKSGRVAQHDSKGKLLGYKEYGPSVVAKATAIGIITDKASVLQAYEQKMTQDINDGKLMMPQDVGGLISAIEGQIKSLRLVDVRFDTDQADLVTNAKEVLADVRNLEEDRPEVVSMDEFDNPA